MVEDPEQILQPMKTPKLVDLTKNEINELSEWSFCGHSSMVHERMDTCENTVKRGSWKGCWFWD